MLVTSHNPVQYHISSRFLILNNLFKTCFKSQRVTNEDIFRHFHRKVRTHKVIKVINVKGINVIKLLTLVIKVININVSY